MDAGTSILVQIQTFVHILKYTCLHVQIHIFAHAHFRFVCALPCASGRVCGACACVRALTLSPIHALFTCIFPVLTCTHTYTLAHTAHIHTCSHRTHTCNHTQTGRQVVSSVKAYICRAHGICKALCPKNELHRSTQSTIISTKKRNTLNRFWCVGDTLAQKRIGSKKQFEL